MKSQPALWWLHFAHKDHICTEGNSPLTSTKPRSLEVFGDHVWPLENMKAQRNTWKHTCQPGYKQVDIGWRWKSSSESSKHFSWFLAWGIPGANSHWPWLKHFPSSIFFCSSLILPNFRSSGRPFSDCIFKLGTSQYTYTEQKPLPSTPRCYLHPTAPGLMYMRWHSTLVSSVLETSMASYHSQHVSAQILLPFLDSNAKNPSLLPSLLPFRSVTGYKWKQQGHSRLYFQSSLMLSK